MTVRIASIQGERPSNQDRALVTNNLVAVADGVGGANRGDAAAQVALGRIAIDSALLGSHVSPRQALEALVEGAHEQALHAAGVFGAVECSATLALAHFQLIAAEASDLNPGPVLLTCAWVGDSPIFLTTGEELSLLTQPHTRAPSGRAGREYLLERALGGVDATPGIVEQTLPQRARVIVATDGFLDVSSSALDEAANDLTLSTGECLALMIEALRDNGVRDNATIAVIDVHRVRDPRELTHRL